MLAINTKNEFNGATALGVIPCRGIAFAVLLAPVLKALRFAVDRVKKAVPTVVQLGINIRPSAIIRTIRTVVIYSVNRKIFGGTWPHVLKKCNEAILPPLADCYSSATIVLITCMTRIVTSVFKRKPYTVFRASGFPFGFTMLGICLNSLAAAGSRASIAEMAGPHGFFRSARAYAIPHGLPFNIRCPGNDSKPSKCFSGEINKVISGHWCPQGVVCA